MSIMSQSYFKDRKKKKCLNNWLKSKFLISSWYTKNTDIVIWYGKKTWDVLCIYENQN